MLPSSSVALTLRFIRNVTFSHAVLFEKLKTGGSLTAFIVRLNSVQSIEPLLSVTLMFIKYVRLYVLLAHESLDGVKFRTPVVEFMPKKLNPEMMVRLYVKVSLSGVCMSKSVVFSPTLHMYSISSFVEFAQEKFRTGGSFRFQTVKSTRMEFSLPHVSLTMIFIL